MLFCLAIFAKLMMGEIENPDLHSSSVLPDIEIICRILIWRKLGEEGGNRTTAESCLGGPWATVNFRHSETFPLWELAIEE